MIALALVVLALLGRLAFERGWPGTAPVKAWWAEHHDEVWQFVRGSPATFLYLGVLTVTTWVLVGSSPRVVNALLTEQSTNLHQLERDPVHVLFRSAFWLSDYALLLWAALFLVVLAPAEHWLGTSRWLVAFATGHVGATLLTSFGIWLAIRAGAAPGRLESAVDVGVSYGFAAVAALYSYRFRHRWRWIVAGSLILWASSDILLEGDFTAYGHGVAVGIGFALYPLTRSAAVRARALGPLLPVSVGRRPVRRGTAD